MMVRSVRGLGSIIVAAATLAAASAPSLGTPYPGSQAMPEKAAANACGRRYNLTAPAAPGAVANYYLAQGRAAGLALAKDTGESIPGYRILSFVEKGPGRVLFVTVQAAAGGSKASVYFVSARRPGCQ